ncbi:hypothetical protein [Pseudogemmobacter sp. W21_MBD1_M6]|uniref:hypothetical protein n=1 Tax=Pseudogemmobacter sp. W21_MBD1_M6 TaxID=3240271 RepID=UPI003F98D5D3
MVTITLEEDEEVGTISPKFRNYISQLNHLTELLLDLYPDSVEEFRNDSKYLALLGTIRFLSEDLLKQTCQLEVPPPPISMEHSTG